MKLIYGACVSQGYRRQSGLAASPVAAIADVLILCASDYPQFFPSMVGVMSAIETLISLIVSRGGDDIIAAIAEQVALRDRIGVYIPG